jgi:hypothetical protein
VNEDSDDWRWADADGVQNSVDEWELVSSLSSGSLPHYTLVWKAGWQTWLPACQVAELSSAIPPDKIEHPRPPKLDPSIQEPPAPPIDKYSTYQTREAAAKLLGRPSRPSTRPPQPPGGITAPGLGAPGRGGVPPPTQHRRAPMPTLVEGPAYPATATLRPPGAVPPPPRPVPMRGSAPELRPPRAAQTPLPPPIGGRRAAEIEELPAEDVKSAVAHEPPTVPLATPGRIELHDKPEILLPAQGDAGGAELPAMPPLRPWRADRRFARPAFWLLLGAGTFGIVAMITVAILIAVRGKKSVPPIATGAPATAAPSPEALARPCTLASKATKLAPSIHHAIPPYVAADSDGNPVVGFAASPNDAVGLAIDLDTLETSRKLTETSQEPITGVVPLTAGGKLSFAIDRESKGLRYARTVDGKPPITIGIADDGFASLVGGGVPRTAWPGGEARAITEPRVAVVDDQGFAVTFRRGGQTGAVVVGWLGSDGSRKTDLAAVKTSRKLIGTPTIGANDREILVAFSARTSANAYWGLQIATSDHGAIPARAHPFSIPPGGLGAEAISPAVAGLAGGRWLLQWTEGSTGTRQVRLQTMGSDLIPIGDPLTVSPEQVNAGQGIVWVRDDRALSLFLVKVTAGHELWGAALKCP